MFVCCYDGFATRIYVVVGCPKASQVCVNNKVSVGAVTGMFCLVIVKMNLSALGHQLFYCQTIKCLNCTLFVVVSYSNLP